MTSLSCITTGDHGFQPLSLLPISYIFPCFFFFFLLFFFCLFFFFGLLSWRTFEHALFALSFYTFSIFKSLFCRPYLVINSIKRDVNGKPTRRTAWFWCESIKQRTAIVECRILWLDDFLIGAPFDQEYSSFKKMAACQDPRAVCLLHLRFSSFLYSFYICYRF